MEKIKGTPLNSYCGKCLSGLMVVALLLSGCASLRSAHEEAARANTFDAYEEFLSSWGRRAGNLDEYAMVEEAQKRPVELFRARKIRSLALGCLDFDDSREVGRCKSYNGNTARNDGYGLFKATFAEILGRELASRGYTVQPGGRVPRLLYDTPAWNTPGRILLRVRDRPISEICLPYYIPPDALRSQAGGADAAFLVLVTGIFHTTEMYGESRPGPMIIGRSGAARVLPDVSELKISYHVLDPGSGERLYAKAVNCRRENNYHGRGRWSYLEDETAFYARCAQELMGDFPAQD